MGHILEVYYLLPVNFKLPDPHEGKALWPMLTDLQYLITHPKDFLHHQGNIYDVTENLHQNIFKVYPCVFVIAYLYFENQIYRQDIF